MEVLSSALVFAVGILTATTMSVAEQIVPVLEGESVDLEIKTQGNTESHTLTWHFNTTKRIVTYHPKFKYVDVSVQYTGRVEFDNQTSRLRLRSVQRNDSGLYTAQTFGDEKALAQYTLIVWESVRTPDLNVLSNQSINGICNVTLTCKGHDLSVTSVCNLTSCSPAGETYANLALTLSFKDDIITCNHSNQFDWKNSTVDMKHLCGTAAVAPPVEVSLFLLIPVSLKALLISVALITRGLQSVLTTAETD